MVALGGILTDRIGAVNAAILFTAVAAMGTAIVASARTMWLMMLGRVVVGLGGESLCAAQLTLLAQCFGTAQVDDTIPAPAADDVMGQVDGAARRERGESGASAALGGGPDAAAAVDGDDVAGEAAVSVAGGEDAIARMGTTTSSLPVLPHAAAAPAAGLLVWQDTFPTTAVAFALQLMVARVGTLSVFLLLPTIFREAGYAAEWVVVAFTLFSFANALLFALLYRSRGWDKLSIEVHGGNHQRRRQALDGVYGAVAPPTGHGTGEEQFQAPLREVGPTSESEHPRTAHIHLVAATSGAGGDEEAGDAGAAGAEGAGTAPLLVAALPAAGRTALSPPPAVRARRRAGDVASDLDALPAELIAGEAARGGAEEAHGVGTVAAREGGRGGRASAADDDATCLQLVWKGLFVDTAYAAAHFKGKLALLGLFLVIYSSISVSLVDFATDMFNERWGYSDVRASQTTSIMTAVAIVSTVPIAYLLDIIQRPGLMLLCGALLVTPGHALLLVARSLPPEFACILIGLGGSVVSATLWPALSGVIQPSQLGTMMGFLLALQNWALCFAPMTVGVVRDRTGGYELVLGTFIALDLVCALLAIAVAVLEGDDASQAELPPAGEKPLVGSPSSRSGPANEHRAGAESYASWDAAPGALPGTQQPDDASEGHFVEDDLGRSASMDWDGMDALPPA